MNENARDERLRSVYGAASRSELGVRYDEWARNYDDDLQAFGYLSPAVSLALATRHMACDEGPILDAGAGTGIMGELLSLLGYRELEALDLSEGMLEAAAAKGVYRALHQAALGDPLDLPDDHYAGVVSVGVFTLAHAGPESLDELLRVTKPGGVMVFTVTEPVYESGFKAKQEALEQAGRWRLLEMTRTFTPLPREADAPMSYAFGYRVV